VHQKKLFEKTYFLSHIELEACGYWYIDMKEKFIHNEMKMRHALIPILACHGSSFLRIGFLDLIELKCMIIIGILASSNSQILCKI